MENNLVISNSKKTEKIKMAIGKDGPEKFHVLADFHQALTRAFVDGKLVPSLISILRDGNYLTPDYAEKAHALFNKYHPIEIDPTISPAKKKKAMREWWLAHFKLLIDSGLNKKDIAAVVSSGKIKLRRGFDEFANFLRDRDIPLVIMSSTGLGGDAIALLLQKENLFYDNIYIVSNVFEWDKNGRAVMVKEPVIHSMNRDETALRNFPFFEKIKPRKNVLLLGNALDDIGMIAGFDCKNLLKIGFLNEAVGENLENFKKNFDAVLLNDPGMNFITALLQKLFPAQT